MKIDIITDLHLIEEIIDLQLSEIEKQLFKSDSLTLVVLGDIFDNRHYVNDILLNKIKYFFFEKLKHRYRHIYFVTGNHDKSHDDNVLGLLSIFKGFEHRIIIIDDFEYVILGKYYYFFCPFFTDDLFLNKFNFYLEKFKKRQIDKKNIILFGHKTFKNYQYSKNYSNIVTGGLSIDKELNRFRKVFLGDLHHRQNNKNIYYIGSFFQRTFGEDNNKGLLTYDVERDKVICVQKTRRFYKTLILDDLVNKQFLDKKELLEIVNRIKEKEILNLKFVVKGERNDLIKFPESFLKDKFGKDFRKFVFEFKPIEDEKDLKGLREDDKNYVKDILDYFKNEKMNDNQIVYGKELLL